MSEAEQANRLETIIRAVTSANKGDPTVRLVPSDRHDRLDALADEINTLLRHIAERSPGVAGAASADSSGAAASPPDDDARVLRFSMDEAPEAVFWMDESGGFAYVNEQACRSLGYTRAELLQLHLWDIDPGFPRDRLASEWALYRKGELGMQHLETWHRRKDGVTFPVEVSSKHIWFGEREFHIAFVRDIADRRSVERALEFTQFAVDHAAMACFWIDSNGRFLHVNRQACQSLGYSKDELLGMSLHDVDPEFSADRWGGFFDRLRAANSITLESLQRRKAGDRFPVEVTATFIAFEGQEYCCAFASDISDRKLSEMALQESRAMLRQVLDTIPVRVFWKDAEGHYLGCNRPFATDAGFDSPKGLLGKMDREMAWAEQADLYRADDQKVIASGSPRLAYEEPQTTPSGATLHLRTSKVPLRDLEGRIIGVLGTYEDISEAKHAEQALRASMNWLRAVVTNAPIALYSFDAKGIFTLSEGMGLAGMGLRSGELVGRSAFEVFRDRPDVLESLQRSLAGETFTWSVSFGEHVFDAHHTAWQDEHGAHAGTIGVLVDVTDRKRVEAQRASLEAQLLQAQKMESVGRLAGGVAHDFNNTLMVILGCAELLKKERAEDAPLLASVSEIERAAGRARDVTRQLLAFSRKQVIAPRAVSLTEFLADTKKTLGRLIGEDVDLRVHLAAEPWVVRMDPSQLDQIVMNLVVNARDAMPKGGKLTIETANVRFDEAYCRQHVGFQAGEYVLLAVSDSGAGMDRETLSHVFEPFFTTKSKGTGLGLATVYGVVTQNGGVVNAYSEPGRGSTFKVYLPRLRESAEGTSTPEEAPHSLGGGTVLLVEDDAPVRRVAAGMLDALGFTVLVARGWREALELAGRKDLDIRLLLTDVVMPEVSGRELSDRARASRPGLPVLYMSGYTGNVIVHHGVLDEGVHFIQKPFTLDDLARGIRDAL